MKDKTLISKREELFKLVCEKFARYRFSNDKLTAEEWTQQVLDLIKQQDKEFIQKLKEEFVLDNVAKSSKYTITALEIHEVIDKLASEELAYSPQSVRKVSQNQHKDDLVHSQKHKVEVVNPLEDTLRGLCECGHTKEVHTWFKGSNLRVPVKNTSCFECSCKKFKPRKGCGGI